MLAEHSKNDQRWWSMRDTRDTWLIKGCTLLEDEDEVKSQGYNLHEAEVIFGGLAKALFSTLLVRIAFLAEIQTR